MRLLTIRIASVRYGSENHMLRIACAAAMNGIDVHAAFPRAPGTVSMVDECIAAGVHYWPFDYRVGKVISRSAKLRSVLSLIFQVLQLRSLLNSVRPDVVQFTGGWPTDVLAPSIACALCRIPLLAVFQFAATTQSLPKMLLEVLAWARQRRQRWMAVSQQNLSCLQASYQTNEIGILANGIEITEKPSKLDVDTARRDLRNELGLPITAKILLTTARFARNKGHADLLAIIPKVIGRFPDVIFVWAGDGEYRKGFEEQSARQGLQGHVRFLGYRTDVTRWLHASDLFIFPSHSEGGCSSSIREAMVNCLPIICSNAGGIPEMILDGVHGLVFPVQDLNGMFEHICHALSNPAEMRRLAEQARTRIEDFSLNRTMENYLAVFRELVGAQSPSGSQCASQAATR